MLCRFLVLLLPVGVLLKFPLQAAEGYADVRSVVLIHCWSGEYLGCNADPNGGYLHVSQLRQDRVDEGYLFKFIPSKNDPDYFYIWHVRSKCYVAAEGSGRSDTTGPVPVYLCGSITPGKEDDFLFKIEAANKKSAIPTIRLSRKPSQARPGGLVGVASREYPLEVEWRGEGRSFRRVSFRVWAEYYRGQRLHTFWEQQEYDPQKSLSNLAILPGTSEFNFTKTAATYWLLPAPSTSLTMLENGTANHTNS